MPLTGLIVALAAAAQPAAIELNQIGFTPDSAKLAILPSTDDRPIAWRVVDAADRTVLQGRSEVGPRDAALGYRPHRIDLTALRTFGTGYRVVAGAAASPPFAIRADLYRPLARDALAFFYHQRAGTPITARFAGGAQWARPAGHPSEVVRCFAGPDRRGVRWDGCSYRLDVAGGWYDAGDHGKYVVNGGISVWTLLNLHEWLGTAAPGDGTQPIPEAGNGVSDLLDEARWEVEFLLRMQVPDSSRQSLPVGPPGSARREVDTSGMAHHKVADARWTGIPMRPDRDPETRLLYPPSTAATLNLAAVAAQCARVWREIDAAFAARCRTAATRAWAAALRNPQIHAGNDFDGSGGYGDDDLSDEFFWAAAELFAATGEPSFLDMVEGLAPFQEPIAAEPGWSSTAPLGIMTLAIAPSALPAAEVKRLRGLIAAAAARFATEDAATPYRLPFAGDRYGWGSNAGILNRAILLAMAARWTGEARYRTAAVDAMDYALGRNPLGISYVSGYGTTAMRNPHHRFWAHQFDASYPGPPPGVLSGGANNSAMDDDVSRTMKGRCAPQRCWADDARAFTFNEVAINWNAPLAWVATWLDREAFAKPLVAQ